MKKQNLPSVFENYVTYLEEQLLNLEVAGLTPVTAQVVLLELRNRYFKQSSNLKDSIVESILQKDLDYNIYSAGIASLLKEYIELDILNYMGYKFDEYARMPLFLKENIKAVISEKHKIKKKAEDEEERKRKDMFKGLAKH